MPGSGAGELWLSVRLDSSAQKIFEDQVQVDALTLKGAVRDESERVSWAAAYLHVPSFSRALKASALSGRERRGLRPGKVFRREQSTR